MGLLTYAQRRFQGLLIHLQVPLLYQRVVVWWETKASLREYLKAARAFLHGRGIAMRNAVFGSAMIVVTKQIQSRQELRDMSWEQIMHAYRSGRLDYLMKTQEHYPIGRYGDQAFANWVHNGGQVHRGNPRTYRRNRLGR